MEVQGPGVDINDPAAHPHVSTRTASIHHPRKSYHQTICVLKLQRDGLFSHVWPVQHVIEFWQLVLSLLYSFVMSF